MKTTRSALLLALLLAGNFSAAQQAGEIADRLAIEDILARYSFAWDFNDADAFVALFTEDAIWEMYAFDADEPIRRYESREAIRVFAEESKSRRPGVKTAHHQSGLMLLEMAGSSARSQNMVIITQQSIGQANPDVVRSGVYYDSWRKTPDGWRIAHRVLRLDGSAPEPE